MIDEWQAVWYILMYSWTAAVVYDTYDTYNIYIILIYSWTAAVVYEQSQQSLPYTHN